MDAPSGLPRLRLGGLTCSAALVLAGGAFAGEPAPVDFNRDIRPIFSAICFKCHGGVKQESGLSLLYRKEALEPAASKKRAIVPGKPEESELIRRITTSDLDDRMPPKGNPLGAKQIDDFKLWIAQGAPYDDHWAFVKPKDQPPPPVKDVGWPRNGMDFFVLSHLEKEGLQPSPEADRYTLARRLSLDLTGLPPSLEETAAFVRDPSPKAYEALVDRLLASPHYGERWARLWLDLARYADTQGYEKDNRRTIWRYRDWLIDAFNKDMPFDQFTIEQIAGDLLPNPTLNQLIATAFHRNTMTNTEGGTDDEEFRVAAVLDRVNTTWQVWMGTTFGCVQCHSHPYDPFRHDEYYRFFAFYNQTEDNDQPDETPTIPSPTPEQKAEADRLEASIALLKQKLEAPSPELEATQQAWEESLRGATEWKVLRPRAPASTTGATLTLQEDGSVLASGKAPPNDTYTLTALAGLERVTAFKLEALTDNSLPHQGPGRADDGNFVLSRFSASVVPVERKPVKGRYVRIDLPGKERILSLAEVEVLGARESSAPVNIATENIAKEGEARQSSTEHEAEAGLAIDGNRNGHFTEARSTTHTRAEDDPWWELDLKSPEDIYEIAVWNRTDGGLQSRLDNFRLSILDSERKLLWQGTAPTPKESVRLGPSASLAFSLKQASADFSQGEFPVEHALNGRDPKKNGWAVQPEAGKPHQAAFGATGALDVGPTSLIEIKLEQSYERPGFTLGHFRLSVTDDAKASQRLAVPANILAIINKGRESQSTEERTLAARYYKSVAPRLQPLRDELAKLESELKEIPIPTTPIFRERPPEKRRTTQRFIRGSFLSKGEKVEEGVPASMHPFKESLPKNRLGLAKWLVDEDNPLTARVLVNRVWEQLFGLGIVETSEDFGTQGSLPSHPELLDWLALQVIHEHQWSLKSLLKQIVTSSTYRQSSKATLDLLERDPKNRLLARGPRFRIEAELIRDQALSVSGLLSPKMFGPSVMPPQPEGIWQVVYSGDTWVTPASEDRYRRGLYTFWRRTSPYPSMMTFDATSREFCVVRRVRTNTPLQALVTLNDPVYVEAAQALARKIVSTAPKDARPEERAALGFRLSMVRPPDEDEVQRLVALFKNELGSYKKDEKAARQMATDPLGPAPEGIDIAELAAWTVVSNVLLNLDEFLTKT